MELTGSRWNLCSFFHKLRLKAFFASRPDVYNQCDDSNEDTSGFNGRELGLCPKSNLFPPQDHHAIETYITLVHDEKFNYRELSRGVTSITI